MTTLIAYTRIVDAITTHSLRLPDAPMGQQSAQEIATLPDGRTVVALFDGFTLPTEQPAAIAASIEVLPVPLPDSLRDAIKTASPHVRLIADRMQQRIRAAYSVENEAYFSRIGVGAALGVYTLEPGEQEALLAFGEHVESVRQWGRGERAKLGL